jgi:hypothetical protein
MATGVAKFYKQVMNARAIRHPELVSGSMPSSAPHFIEMVAETSSA